MKLSAKTSLAFALTLVLACSSSADRTPSPKVDEPSASPALGLSIAHRDARLGVPTFAWIDRGSAPRFATALEAAATTVRSLSRSFALSRDAEEAIVAEEVDERETGPVVTRFRQRVAGVDVFRGGLSVLMTRAYEPVSVSGLLATSVRGSDRAFALEPEEALERSFRALGVAPPRLARAGAQGDYERFAAAGVVARTKRVYFPVKGEDGVELEPAVYVDLMLSHGPARSYVLSAIDGRVLFANDLVHYEAFTYRVYADPQSFLPMDGPQGNAVAPHPTGKPDRMKLTWQPSQLVTLANLPFSKNDPWLPADATTTTGNNVTAYADLAAPDGFDPATDRAPALTSAATFDHLYDPNASPGATPASIQAAATHLFYVTNFLHDWFYDAGFDEAGKNHQTNNFGRGGLAIDPLIAEAQDNSGRNNANAAVPPDGMSPRIQMFVFSGSSNAELVVSAPANIAGTKSVGIASGFGKDVFETSGTVALAVDEGGADPNDACEPIAQNLAGKIALIHRGTCSFAQKAQNAEAAGAVGAIIANVATSASPSSAPFMGGQQAGITIPVLSLSVADGQALEAAVASGATVTMKRSAGSDLDGALDTTIVAHEWGHVLSSRLVGDGNGLTTNQAGGLGEGWGDFLSMLIMARADESPWAGAYGQGSYATSGSGDDVYFGTRRVPYSIDFTKNPLTLKHIQNGVALPTEAAAISFGEDGSFNAEVHNTGEIWATMLWECYVGLLRDGRHSFAQAQDKMKRYLVASLKATPIDPTIIEARDALLAAAYATDERDFKVFFEAFARRGAGAGAEGPPKDSRTNVGVKESFFAGNDVQIVEATIKDDLISCDRDGILDDGEVGTVEVKLRNTGSGIISQGQVELAPKVEGVTLLDGASVGIPALEPFEATVVKVKATVSAAARALEPLAFDVTVADPTLPAGRVVKVAVPTRYNVDEAAESSAVDRVETSKTSWKVAGKDSFGVEWARTREGDNGYWTIPDPLEAGDHRLTSPVFTIDGTTFSLSFKHRWYFRFSSRRMVDINGGVVEISVDRGKTWKDVSEYAEDDYNTTLDPSRADNELAGRKGYGNRSAGYPDAWVTTKLDVTLPEHPEQVQVRFRVGTSTGRFSTGEGWDIDDVELGGISSTPFWAFIPHADACDPNGPTVSAGLPTTVPARTPVTLVGTGTHPEGVALSFVWTQIAGPPVALTTDGSPTLSFTAPDVSEPATLTFSLRAHDGALLSPASTVDVTVTPNGYSAEGSGCACRSTSRAPFDPTSLVVGVAAFAALRRRRR